jgi:hypothetical protein
VQLADKPQDQWDEVIRRGVAIAELQASEGWKIIEDWLQDNIRFFSQHLIYEKDYEKVRRYQEAVKCFESFKNYPSSVINQSQFIQEQRRNETP